MVNTVERHFNAAKVIHSRGCKLNRTQKELSVLQRNLKDNSFSLLAAYSKAHQWFASVGSTSKSSPTRLIAVAVAYKYSGRTPSNLLSSTHASLSFRTAPKFSKLSSTNFPHTITMRICSVIRKMRKSWIGCEEKRQSGKDQWVLSLQITVLSLIVAFLAITTMPERM